MATFGYKPDKVKPVREMAGAPVDQVYIGSCTNGRIEDLRMAAAVLKGAKIHRPRAGHCVARPRRRYSGRPWMKASSEIFMDAGFCVTNPTCGACLGMSNGVLAAGRGLRLDHQPEFLRPHGQGRHGASHEPGHRRGNGHGGLHHQFSAL